MTSSQIDSPIELQSISSTYTERRRRRVFESIQSGDGKDGNVPTSSETRGAQLLYILGLLNLHSGTIFSVEQKQKWNSRQALGFGASFNVTETDMPIWSALSHLRYRSLDLRGPDERTNFIDHTNTSWDINTSVAYKSIGSQNKHMDAVLQELRVLYHPPLQRHPNIVSLLGVAWAAELETDIENENSAVDLVWSVDTSGQKDPPQEWPSVVIERAHYKSLIDFLNTPTTRVRISLSAKLRFCTNILNAISVSFYWAE
jgi:hypothetical protein